VSDENSIRQSGNEAIPFFRERGGDLLVLWPKRRQDK